MDIYKVTTKTYKDDGVEDVEKYFTSMRKAIDYMKNRSNKLGYKLIKQNNIGNFTVYNCGRIYFVVKVVEVE